MSVLRRGWQQSLCLGKEGEDQQGKRWWQPWGIGQPKAERLGTRVAAREGRNLVRKGGCRRVIKKALTRIVLLKGKGMDKEDGSSTRCLGEQ